jgi:hypothetical protein
MSRAQQQKCLSSSLHKVLIEYVGAGSMAAVLVSILTRADFLTELSSTYKYFG